MNQDYYWLNTNSRTILERSYLTENVTPEQRIRKIAESAEKILNIHGFADKFESYMKKGWISLSSPIWANFGTDRGLPISCNQSYVSDTMEDILYKAAEVGIMTKYGAGTSGYFGDVRPRGAKISSGGTSFGSVHFMQLFDDITNIVSQANVRRGSFAAYLPVDHKDIEEFLTIRDEGHPIQHISIGVCVSDDWMNKMIAGDEDKRTLWGKILEKRAASGYPYIFFTDTVNRNKPQVYKDKLMTIHGSNLCSEICLPTNREESFVCNLASVNLLHWDDWCNTDLVKTVTYFLDAVMTDYINKTEKLPFMKSAYNFAKNHRALGIGVVGWHSLLQSKMTPFESLKAHGLNIEIWKHIKDKSYSASKELALLFGEPEVLKGYGMRNTTTMAVAPTTSSSFILGQVSPSIEPLEGNYFTQDISGGKFTYRNPYLKDVLITKGKDEPEVWRSILVKGGSVQHLDFLSKHEKDVFKTWIEISQKETIIQASQRQKYIDQSQSLNLKIHKDVPVKDLNKIAIFAWEMGVKTLYYQRSNNPAQELGRSIMSCEACES